MRTADHAINSAGKYPSPGIIGKKAADGRTAGRSKPAVIDCRGLVVLPGLIQAHIHLCQTLFRGLADDLSLEAWLAQRIWPLEAAHTEASIHASAMLGAAELLLGLDRRDDALKKRVFAQKRFPIS